MIDPFKRQNIKDVRHIIELELAAVYGREKARTMTTEIDNTELAKDSELANFVPWGLWFCEDCWNLHPLGQTRCNLPCLRNEHDKEQTEDEYEKSYELFDPESYEEDDAHLNFPHSRIFKWMSEAERIYNVQLKRGIEPLRSIAFHYKLPKININDFDNAPTRTEFEKALRLQELRRFSKKYGHPEQMERFWVNMLRLARASIELKEVEKKYNEQLNNGDLRLKAIVAYYGLMTINFEGKSVFEIALRKQELRKMIPERYGEPLPEERFWSWAENYGKQLHSTG